MIHKTVWPTNFIVYVNLIITIFLISIVSCQSQHDPYDEFKFKDIVLCEDLDAKAAPTGVKETVTANSETISLCIYIETDSQFYFAVNWFGPDFSNQTVLKAENDGWIIATTTNPSGFLPGEYEARIFVLKWQKAIKTFQVLEKATNNENH